MKYILKCPNGVQVDMSSYILQQMEGTLEQSEVQERINYYLTNNK
jgi:hypothetical protein